MDDRTANRVSSANSLSELVTALMGHRVLEWPLSEVLDRLKVNADLVARIRATTPDSETLAGFLKRKEVHREFLGTTPYAQLLKAFKDVILEEVRNEPELPVDAVRFDQLLPLVTRGDLASTPMREVLGELGLAPAIRRMFVAQFGAFSVAQFLSEADDANLGDDDFFDLLDVMRAWLEAHQQPSNVIALRHSAARPPGESVAKRLATFGIPDLADWTPSMLAGLGEVGSTTPLTELIRYGGDVNVNSALDAFEQRLEVLRRQPPPQHPPVDDPALLAVQEAARKARMAFAPTYPLDLVSAHASIRTDDARLTANIRPYGSETNAHLVVPDFSGWVKNPVFQCNCRFNPCIHRMVMLEGLMGPWVHNAGSAKLILSALKPGWERLLDFIAAPSKAKVRKPGVLSFKLSPHAFTFLFHEVGKKGPSSTGKRKSADEILTQVEGIERRIVERLALSGRARERSQIDGDALLMLEGHPRVHWADEPRPSPVARAAGTVKIVETATGLRLEFTVNGAPFERTAHLFRCTDGGVMLRRDETGRILVVQISDQYLRLLEVTRTFGSELPREAAPRLLQLLPNLEAEALVELPDDLRGEERAPVERPLVRVEPGGTGLRLAIRVEPLEKGPVFVPGQGLAVSASFDGRRRAYTRRRFEKELLEANALAGTLGLDPAIADDPYTWHLDASDTHVETLRRLSASGVPVEWTGPKVKFTSEATLSRMRLSITRQKDWFGLDGEVTVDDRRVSLASLLEAARARRRFVKLGDGDFAQLSESMLDALAPLSHLGTEGALPRLSIGAAPLIDVLAPQLEGLDAAKEWSALMKRLETAKTATFTVPRTLKATLRDYQVEGFQWLSRLAQWGVGACLADDMGLGKTLQALTLLLARGKQGPALVVAPTSVLHTWRAEAAKFAPSLKLALFHEGDRSLGELGANDVVVVSWTLLAREAEAFAAMRFTTVVLDEAHAIKNSDTQRAKAAHRLQTDFLVALSGTPVENHVGELWSLFKAVMPALLGSEESFRKRFASGNKEALAALSTLVRPFVLRRSKSAVAKELPPRTDLEIVVPLSAEERALYDDVRLSAMSKLGDVTGESKRFDVLAALTRMRLTACHPKLVDAAWAGATSKLSRLLELVGDLSSAGHRVLVFSQFTQHLALVVEAFRAQGITHSYLDGQVPMAERQRRVEAFQRGEGGDVFLVSLKAGGTGLTLTAADYVIHLDPWWNPAVEDQASDRAHRIGQTRPVTVYRLIAEGTIEQQILALHHDKRELVDALLSGADTVGKMSTTQLAALIRAT